MTGARVLVVDDEDDIRLLMRVMLRKAGVEVQEASTAQEGLAMLLSEPDLVLLDIRLPDGDGFDILAEMKRSGQLDRVPVVMVSAHSTPTTKRRALEQGASGYVTKPFTGPELIDAVERALAS